MAQALIMGAMGAALIYSVLSPEHTPNMGSVKNSTKNAKKKEVDMSKVSPTVEGNESTYAPVKDVKSREPFQSCVEQQGAWLSSNLLPKKTETKDDDWNVYNPDDVKDKNFLNAGHHYGVDTVGSSLRNANLQLRSEPIIPKKNISPFMNSSIDADNNRRRFDIQDF